MSFKKIISLSSVLLGFAVNVHAVQDGQLAPPELRMLDPMSVNLQSLQTVASQETVSIGGERGLSHSISMHTNHFTNTGGGYGYIDKYAGNVKYVVFGTQPGVAGFTGTHCDTITGSQVWVMRAFGPEGSEDFKVKINGVVDCHITTTITSGYTYEALRDPRNVLEVSSGALIWTKPDGTQIYYEHGGNAVSAGRLYKIVYPNGYTIDIDFGNVTSNTGFQIKYEYDGNWGTLSSSKQSLFNQYRASLPYGYGMQIPGSWPDEFDNANPGHVRAINRAVDYCTTDATQTCGGLSHSWPAATFTWPGGMPQAIYLGDSVFSVLDPAGRTTEYHYQAQDVMLMEDGAYAGNVNGTYFPYAPNQMWSPRMVGIKSAQSSIVDRVYDYRTKFVLSGNGGTNFWKPVSNEGEVKHASSPEGDASYSRQPRQGGEEATTSNSRYGTTSIEPSQYQGTISFAVVPKRGQFQYESSFRNLITEFIPTGSPEPHARYDYDSRGNLIKITRQEGLADETVRQAGYPASCSSSTRKTCNKPLWVKDARGHQTDYPYHAASGQVDTVTGPADANGIRP
ncbi:MAG TPA: hypothetical protein VL177_08645, partial [Terriglobales bacterium]|nr:hypothetical protein [Terriglobales bacterium]